MFKYPDVDDSLLIMAEKAEEKLTAVYKSIDEISEANQYKVLQAFRTEKVSESDFFASTGYGYNETGRDKIERVYADVFRAEDALVRPQITCGTHAIYLALSANLLPGDELLYITGKPYDSLDMALGIRKSPASLAEYGVKTNWVDLIDREICDIFDGNNARNSFANKCEELRQRGLRVSTQTTQDFNRDAIRDAINERTKIVAIQRSKGYDTRKSFTSEEIGEIISFVRSIRKDIIIFTDNCYGEFVCATEPTDYGADLCVGSLIKNPGGGMASSGGYIVGRKDLVERCAYKLTSPGLGKEVGVSYGMLRSFYMGLSLAPKVVAESLKNAYFLAAIAEMNGYKTYPASSETHGCIVQAVEFKYPEKVSAFCRAIQGASYVDSHVTPEDWDMPGYEDRVIMASGSFTSGSSIELSADGPMRDPYIVYFQGGLTHEQGRYAILSAISKLL